MMRLVGVLAAMMFAACGPPTPARADDTETAMVDEIPDKPKAPKKTKARSQKSFPTEAPAGDFAVVSDTKQLEGAIGKQVRLQGTYVEAVQSARPDATPVGHVAVKLADGTEVAFLPPWHDDALRPEAEVAAMAGKRVEVVGMLRSRIPQKDPNAPPAASRVMPCIIDVLALRPL